MGKTENPENPDVSDPAEGEQEEGTEGDNQSPVIEEEAPSAEETTEENDGTSSILSVTPMDDPAPEEKHTWKAEFDAEEVEVNGIGSTEAEYTKPAEDAPLEFTVTAKTGYRIDSVTYTVGGGTAKAASEKEGVAGTYQIPAADLTGDIVVTITAKKTYEITVNCAEQVDFAITNEGLALDNKKVTVDEGATLNFTAKLKEDNKTTHRITKIAFTDAEDKEHKLTIKESGSYTIANIPSNLTITIETEAIKTIDVTFASHANITKIKNIQKDGVDADPAEITGNGDWKIAGIEEGTRLSFEVEATAPYKVKAVKAGDTVLTARKGVYTFTPAEETGSISIETELDPVQSYALDLNIVGDKDSATVTLSMPENVENADGAAASLAFPADGAFVTQNQKLHIKVEAKANYALSKKKNAEGQETEENDVTITPAVEGAELTATAGKTDEWDITLVKGKTATLQVKTEAAALADGTTKTVTFNLDEGVEEVMTLNVPSSTLVEADSDVTGKYNLKAGLKTLDFTVTATGAYVPTVENKAGDAIAYKNVVRDAEAGTRTYSYSLNAGALDAAEVLTIRKEESKANLTFVYNEAEAEVVVKQGATEVELENNAVAVAEGETVTIEATANENCRITKIETTTEGTTKVIIAPKGGTDFHKFVLSNVSSDTTVTITSASASYVKSLTAGETELNPDAKGVYSVTDSVAYTAAVTVGVDEKVAISKFELKDKNNVVAPTTGEGDEKVTNYTTRFLPGDNDVTITLKDVLAGKTLTLILYDDPEGENVAAKQIATYTLKVEPRLDDVEIKINKNQKIDQKADTVATYAVDAKGADANGIKVEISGTNEDVVVEADTKIANGVLTVKTGYGVNKTTKLKFSYEDKNGVKQYVKKAKNSQDPLELEVKALPVVNEATTAPKVTLASATDVSLTLALDAKAAKLPAETAQGKVYYQIEVTPKATVEGKTKPEKIVNMAFTKYVLASTTEKVLYVGTDTSESGKPALGTGGAWDFDVAVKLVHVKGTLADEDTAPAAGNIVVDGDKQCMSKVFSTNTKPFSTKALAYETKLGLTKTKAAGAVYTTQENVTVATPKWSKDTSYRKLSSARDITQGLVGTDGALSVSTDGDEVKVSATTNTALGKHTIEVLATYDGTRKMYAARATLVVNVVRGIEDLSIGVPTTSLYQAENKAASLKAVVNYNERLVASLGTKNGAPKAKKVNWYLVGSDVTDVDEDTVKSTSLASGLIKIDKSGKVSVDKKYQVNAATSSFKILAEAADFEGNKEFDLSDTITITRKGISLDAAAVVAYDSNASKYTVKAVTGGTAPLLTAGELDGLTLAGIMPGLSAAVDKEYAKAAFDNYKIDGNLTYTSSNKKAVEVASNGAITVKAPAKNVKLTVATADGTNLKKDVTVTVRYDDNSGELGLEIERDVKSGDNTREQKWTAQDLWDTPEIEFYDSAAAYFNLKVRQRLENETWDDIPEFTNYKITVSGGKNLGTKNGITNIVIDKKVATVKLEYTHYNPETKRDDKKTETYALTNAGYNAQGLAKAPKITFRNKVSSVKAVVETGDTSRYIGFNLQTNGKNYPLDFNEGKEVFYKADGKFDHYGEDLYVRVDVDGAAITAKNEQAIKALANSIQPKGYEKVNARSYGGYVQLDFNDTALTPGSYKLKVGVGTIDVNSNFVLAAEPANITIKVVADKKLSFKPAAAYKISAKNGTVALTGKTSDSSVVYNFKNLQNANVNDKKQGEVNEFTKYFTLDEDTSTLKMTDQCYVEYFDEDGKLKKNFGKKDLFGYVDYEAGYAYTADKDKITGTTKITVTLQDNAIIKYAISNASAGQAANSVANVTVTANKKPVDIAYAAVETEGWQAVVADQSSGWKASAEVTGSTITLQHTAALMAANAKVTVKVIPDDSLHKAKVTAIFEGTGTDAEKLTAANAYIKANGVELKTTITLKDMDDSKTTKRISVDGKNLTLRFTGDWSTQGNLTSEDTCAESGYDPEHENYWIDVPYTDLFDGAGATVKDITVDNTAHNMFSFGCNTEDSVISIALNKSALQDANTQALLYNKKSNATDWSSPKAIKVAVSVNYKKTTNAEEVAASDRFTFTLTAPANPTLAADGKTSFQSAIAKLGETSPWDESLTYQGEIEEQVGIKTGRNLEWVWRETEDNWWKNREDLQWVAGLDDAADSDAAKKMIFEAEAQGHLRDITKWYLGGDCGIDIDGANLTTVTDSDGFKLPTAEADGKITIKATFTGAVKEAGGGNEGGGNESGGTGSSTAGDGSRDGEPTTSTTPQRETEEVTFTITLPKHPATAADVKNKLTESNYTYTVKNNTEDDEIWADIMSSSNSPLKKMDLKDIRIDVNLEITKEATTTETGEAKITVTIIDLVGPGAEYVKDGITIATLPNS